MKKSIRILNICMGLVTFLIALQIGAQKNGRKIHLQKRFKVKIKTFKLKRPKRLSKHKMALERARLKKQILLKQKERLKKLAPLFRKRRQDRKKREAARARELAMRKAMQQRMMPKIVKKPVPAPVAPSRDAIVQAFKAGKISTTISGKEFNFALSGASQEAFLKIIRETIPPALFGLDVEKFNKKSKGEQQSEIKNAYDKIMVPWRNPDRYPPQSREFVRKVSETVYRSMVNSGWIRGA